tara:strand:- start:17021 stop:17809 length:789 start_codon:yes stop_codon:yes gene_type:complete
MAFTPLKYKFDKELLELLSDKITSEGASFDRERFRKATQPLLDPLELKDRVNVIADQLNFFLPGDYKSKLNLLVQILGPTNEGSYGTFNDFFWTWPIGSFIERNGLGEEGLSLNAIKELTQRGTGEFAIRPFIRQNPEHLIRVMAAWSNDQNFHVRRLASEGLRPNLPWASKLKLFIDDPSPIFKILENLKDDPEKYVQTSVANHINDYFKVNNEAAVALIEKWSVKPQKDTRWIVKHAIRNYRKKGETWAIELTEKMNSLN